MPSLFQNFPIIDYSGATIRDISKRFYIPDRIKNRSGTFDVYVVKDEEKIEDVAYKYYGDPEYHYLIILMNDIIDPFYDWPLSYKELVAYVSNIYPGFGNALDAPAGIHHYELAGQVVSASTPGAVSISNFDYEDRKNESKRKIKLLRKEYLSMVSDELTKVFL